MPSAPIVYVTSTNAKSSTQTETCVGKMYKLKTFYRKKSLLFKMSHITFASCFYCTAKEMGNFVVYFG